MHMRKDLYNLSLLTVLLQAHAQKAFAKRSAVTAGSAKNSSSCLDQQRTFSFKSAKNCS